MVAKTPEDYAEQATRRQIPRTTQAWLAEIGGITKFCDQKPQLLESSGQAWFNNMRNYNLARVRVLLANKPPGLPKKLSHAIVKAIEAKLA